MKTVLQSLKDMEVSLLKNQPELHALEEIDYLRARLIDRPGAIEMLAKLQEECAPQADKTKTELDVIRDAIQILEDQEMVPESELASDYATEPVLQEDTDELAVEQPA